MRARAAAKPQARFFNDSRRVFALAAALSDTNEHVGWPRARPTARRAVCVWELCVWRPRPRGAAARALKVVLWLCGDFGLISARARDFRGRGSARPMGLARKASDTFLTT